MKHGLLFLAFFAVFTTFSQTDCSELFISEYVEGWSNNKALEIYNPTSNTVNLSGYFVARYSNGSTTATVANAVQLSGTIQPYGVYVAVLEKLDPNGTGQEAQFGIPCKPKQMDFIVRYTILPMRFIGMETMPSCWRKER